MSSNLVREGFVDAVLAGDASETDVDDFIDAWHQREEEDDDGKPLSEYLGFTPHEYALWVEQPSVLKFLLYSKNAQHQS